MWSRSWKPRSDDGFEFANGNMTTRDGFTGHEHLDAASLRPPGHMMQRRPDVNPGSDPLQPGDG